MTDKKALLMEGLYEHGEVRCGACDSVIDLNDCDDLNDAKNVWNSHVKEQHR